MYLIAVYFEIFIQDSFSLKEKRMVVRKVKDRVFSKFKIRVAEVEHLDSWQRSGLAFSIVSNGTKNLEIEADKIINFVIEVCPGEVLKFEKYFESYR